MRSMTNGEQHVCHALPARKERARGPGLGKICERWQEMRTAAASARNLDAAGENQAASRSALSNAFTAPNCVDLSKK